jgi:hypothetical protein
MIQDPEWQTSCEICIFDFDLCEQLIRIVYQDYPGAKYHDNIYHLNCYDIFLSKIF